TLEENLQLTETDMTLFFRLLGSFKKEGPLDGSAMVHDSFYSPGELSRDTRQKWVDWFSDYTSRLHKEPFSDSERMARMNAVNPKYVLRNYMAQLAIDAAEEG